MKKFIVASISTALLFTGTVSTDHQAEASTTKKLDEKSKIALAYFTKDITDYSFSRKEIISGKYTLRFPGGTFKRSSKTFDVFEGGKIKGAPRDMHFYSTVIPKGNFATIIGVSNSTIIVSGTQSVTDYKNLVKTGKKYNMKNYLKYRNTKDFKTIVNKTRIVKAPY